jgi:hypothetical protein
MLKHLILPFLMPAFSLCAVAQSASPSLQSRPSHTRSASSHTKSKPSLGPLKFGIILDYEHFTSHPEYQVASSSLYGAGLVFSCPVAPHVELYSTPAIAFGSGHIGRYVSPRGGGPGSGVSITYKETHNLMTVPVYFCFALPVHKSTFFAGPGLTWSVLHMSSPYNYTDGWKTPSFFSFSMVAGWRLRDRWVLSGEYRPSYSTNSGNSWDRLSNSLAVKLGILLPSK